MENIEEQYKKELSDLNKKYEYLRKKNDIDNPVSQYLRDIGFEYSPLLKYFWKTIIPADKFYRYSAIDIVVDTINQFVQLKVNLNSFFDKKLYFSTLDDLKTIIEEKIESLYTAECVLTCKIHMVCSKIDTIKEMIDGMEDHINEFEIYDNVSFYYIDKITNDYRTIKDIIDENGN